jgi:hypothetical protein
MLVIIFVLSVRILGKLTNNLLIRKQKILELIDFKVLIHVNFVLFTRSLLE